MPEDGWGSQQQGALCDAVALLPVPSASAPPPQGINVRAEHQILRASQSILLPLFFQSMCNMAYGQQNEPDKVLDEHGEFAPTSVSQ